MITEGDIIMDHLCEEHFDTIDYLMSEGFSGSLTRILMEDHELTNEEANKVIEAYEDMNSRRNRMATPGNENISNAIKGDILARLNNGAHHQNKADIDLDMIMNDPRDWLQEAYEEALDLAFYLKAAMIKRGDYKGPRLKTLDK
tara:strand:+ start:81 stop:512 length:432 start_codon:yes stop_codon:yes gene_type:complete